MHVWKLTYHVSECSPRCAQCGGPAASEDMPGAADGFNSIYIYITISIDVSVKHIVYETD